MQFALLRLVVPLAAVALVAVFLGHGGGAAGAQGGAVAVGFHGRVMPASAEVTAAERQAFRPVSRMVLEVVVARDADDVTLCARTMITMDQPYEIEIPARWPCASRTVADPAPELFFLVNGVQAATHGRVIVNPNLSAPQTLGSSYQRDLEIPFGAVVPDAPVSSGGRLLRVRYWGTATLAGRPAPDGTVVRVVTDRDGRLCGTGVVEDGLYVVNVPATPGECTHRTPNDETIFLAFTVNGERVDAHGRDIASPAYIGPGSLAHAYRRDLVGRSPPPDPSTCAREPVDGLTRAKTVTRTTSGPSWRRLVAEPRLGQPRNPLCQPIPARVVVEGDDEWQDTIARCFRRIRAAAAASPLFAEFLADFDRPITHADPHGVKVIKDLLLAKEGETQYIEEAAIAGERQGATIRLNPVVVGGVDWLNAAGFGSFPPGLCYVLVHELSHAREALTGTIPYAPHGAGMANLPKFQILPTTHPAIRFGLIPVTEVIASLHANRYAVVFGLPSVSEYLYAQPDAQPDGSYPTLTLRLPPEVVHPPLR